MRKKIVNIVTAFGELERFSVDRGETNGYYAQAC
jgi:hypothetical protein